MLPVIPSSAFSMEFFSLKGKTAIVTGGNSGLGQALALALAGLHHGQSVFLTKPVAGAPDISITLFVGNVLALIDHIHGTKNDVIMDVALINMGSQHIGIFPLQHFIGKLLPDLMGLFRRGLAGGKGLYQVVGQIVALLVRLI